MIRATICLVLLALSGVFGWLYYVQYFRWRDCFNALGRCFDDAAGVVYLEQSGAIWASLAGMTLVAALYQAWRLRGAKG
ncbi:hypothetical protein [uncultured Roseovarius sp.]|uniref:hypothetical protein n=1 Tax=uncultured Roseovarius sp. TaxID=293344 RepID=UPI0025F3E54C|nr:hypothetical protein [uncultured Roseovarius sp.]